MHPNYWTLGVSASQLEDDVSVGKDPMDPPPLFTSPFLPVGMAPLAPRWNHHCYISWISISCGVNIYLAQEYCFLPSCHRRTGKSPDRDQQTDSLQL